MHATPDNSGADTSDVPPTVPTASDTRENETDYAITLSDSVDLGDSITSHENSRTGAATEARPALDSRLSLLSPELTPTTHVDSQAGRDSPSLCIQTSTGKPMAVVAVAPRATKISANWKLWIPEAIALVFSLVSFVVIIAVLCSYNDRPLPSLPFNITLNAFISFFASLSHAGFMIPITTCISQMKWNWFSRGSHALADFELFDASSRGVWGSLGLIYKVRWRHPTSIAAFVTVLGLVSSSVTQLLISYPSRLAPTDAIASIRAVQNYKVTTSNSTLYYSAQNGAEDAYNHPIQPLAPTCPTSNCTFPIFQSLAICHQIANVTSSLQVRVIDPALVKDTDSTVTNPALFQPNATEFNVSLPNGPYMVTQSLTSVIVSPLAPGTSLAFKSDPDLMAAQILSFGAIYSSPYEWGTKRNLTTFYALEVLFHPCVQRYNVSVSNNIPTSQILQSAYEVSSQSSDAKVYAKCPVPTYNNAATRCGFYDYDDWGTKPRPKIYLKNPEKPDSATGSDLFGTSFSIMNYMTNVLAGAFNALYAADPRSNPLYYGEYFTGFLGLHFGTSNLARAGSTPEEIHEIINTFAASISMGMTNSMRTEPENSTAISKDGLTYFYNISGAALGLETFVFVSWGWLAFLGTQLFLATLVLIMTILDTEKSQTKVLKSSAIATLVALDNDSRAKIELTEMKDCQELQKQAATVQIRLDSGGMLSLSTKVIHEV
ncbi:hypothetical protein GQ53DRAFT_816859 [Thozetella sp. PMI_491]|nr:hypothetical protein GQ53DRAFT_816859 [Thozetella sp. PMI_491]